MTVYIVQYFVWFVVRREALKKRLRILPDRTVSGRMLCVFVFFFYVALISGLRATYVGRDTIHYSANYLRVIKSESLYEILQEQGKGAFVFVTIEYFLGFFSDSPQLYIAVFSLIVAVGWACFVYRDSVNVWFSCFLYIGMNYFYRSMNFMRQYTAAGIALNAYLDLAKNPKRLRGWLLFLIAVGIHASCIVLLPAVFLSRFSERHSVKKVTAYTFGLSLLAFISISILYDMFIAMFEGYAHYSFQGITSNMPEHGNWMLYLLYFGITMSYTIRKWHSPVSSKYYMNALLGSTLGILFYRNEMILRVILYYNMLNICFIPEIFSLYPKRERIFLYTICFIGFFCYATRHLLLGGEMTNPHTFFFLED